jgi:hypothetical protein
MKRTLTGIIRLSLLTPILLVCGRPSLGQSQIQTPAQKAGSFKFSAIQVQQIQSEDVKLPAEFQMSLYENVIEQVDKTKRFQHVYRDGESSAMNAPDLVTLHCTVTGFKQGSAMARQVTTVAGTTTIAVHMQFTDKDGKSLFENDAKGQVRFFGENLRATYDFGKKVGAVVRENFKEASPASK